MKQKIKITGSGIHDLLFEGFLIRMAFDATIMKFHIERDTEDGQQVLNVLLEDDERGIAHFKTALENRDYNTDERQIRTYGHLMEKSGSKVKINKIEYEPYEDEVPELLLAITLNNCEMINAFCPKTADLMAKNDRQQKSKAKESNAPFSDL